MGTKPTGFFARIITPEKRAKVEGLFAIHGQKIVMIARFMPGVRAVTYFTAGSVGMPYWRFIFWDGLAALLSAPVFVYLGYHFGSELDSLIGVIKEFQYYVMGGLVVLGVGVYLWRRSKAAKAKKQADAAEALQRATVVPIAPESAAGDSKGETFLDAAEKQQLAARSLTSEMQK